MSIVNVLVRLERVPWHVSSHTPFGQPLSSASAYFTRSVNVSTRLVYPLSSIVPKFSSNSVLQQPPCNTKQPRSSTGEAQRFWPIIYLSEWVSEGVFATNIHWSWKKSGAGFQLVAVIRSTYFLHYSCNYQPGVDGQRSTVIRSLKQFTSVCRLHDYAFKLPVRRELTFYLSFYDYPTTRRWSWYVCMNSALCIFIANQILDGNI